MDFYPFILWAAVTLPIAVVMTLIGWSNKKTGNLYSRSRIIRFIVHVSFVGYYVMGIIIFNYEPTWVTFGLLTLGAVVITIAFFEVSQKGRR